MVIARSWGEATKRVTILGSTGSIGENTIRLLEQVSDSFVVEALTAHSNVSLLATQAKRLSAKTAVIAEQHLYNELKAALSGTDIEVLAGQEAITEVAGRTGVDWVMAAIVGAAGLSPTIAAIRTGKTVAFASKECLVCAGELMMQEVKKHGTTLLPVDSEHSAIFQVLDIREADAIEQITLTASGGPFRTMERQSMAYITPEQAIAHPNWNMGKKISIDSATMMNKGLELIEAYHLFPVEESQLKVLIHPESIIHSMVAYKDGSVLAQLGTADMCTPISVALGWPKRLTTSQPRLDLAAIAKLTFEMPDENKFPALRLARHALKTGGIAPIILNAANEVAVEAFIQRRIGFLEITAIVEECLQNLGNTASPHSLEEVIVADNEVRSRALETITKCKAA